VLTISFDTWREYINYLLTTLLDQPEFIWRGQRLHHWKLEPGLNRLLYKRGYSPTELIWSAMLFKHLERFKLASRGRGDLDPRALEERVTQTSSDEADEIPRMSPAEREENNWWAVGQHYGLQTPLLDWSTSPFVATFFAYEQEHPEAERDEQRVVYGLHKRFVAQRSDELREGNSPPRRPSVIDFIEPLYKDNPRLISQGGLFTRSPNGMAIKGWVQTYFNGKGDEVWMLEFTLPDEERERALKALNRMNINHQSLFPDLYGATAFVNFRLLLDNY
jgi:hypothetical protein